PADAGGRGLPASPTAHNHSGLVTTIRNQVTGRSRGINDPQTVEFERLGPDDFSRVLESYPSATTHFAMMASTPKSLLGRHRLLAPSAAVNVSPLSLGGMSMYSVPRELQPARR